jgi:hypothetical protein
MRKSTGKARSRKAADPSKWPAGRPRQPFANFPLTPHVSGKWMKKIRGNIHYFGKWARRVNGQLARVDGDG